MTRRAAAFIVLTIVLYLFANQTGVGWLYIIVAMLGSLILVSIPQPSMTIGGLTVTREVRRAGESASGRLGDLFEEDELEVALTINNPGGGRRYFLTLTENCPLESPDKALKRFFLPSLQGYTHHLTYRVSCYKRGVFSFPPVALESRGPFGLFRRRRNLQVDTKITVYPQYYEVPSAAIPQHLVAQLSRSPRAGEGGEFYGTREYRIGDSMRRVHWRSTARVGDLVVKEFEDTAKGELAVVIDTSAEYGEGRDSTL